MEKKRKLNMREGVKKREVAEKKNTAKRES